MPELRSDEIITAEDKQLLAEAFSQYELAQAIMQFVGNHIRKKHNLPPEIRIYPDGKLEYPESNGVANATEPIH